MTNLPTRFETLYKTDSPKDFANGEYYQVRIESDVDEAGKTHYFVRENHGYFNNEQKRMVHPVTTYLPEEGYDTHEQAAERYEQQLAHRASGGFVHAFSLDPFEGMMYRKLSS